MNRISLVACASLAFAGCATTPEGTPDCSQAAAQRAGIQAGIVAGGLIHAEALNQCKDGEAGDKCRKIADGVYSGATAAANVALILLNSRCPQ